MNRGTRRVGRAAVALVTSLVVVGAVLTPTTAQAAEQCRTKITLGTSVQGRPIIACQLGNPSARPMLFIGQIHGNEPAGRTTAAKLMSTVMPSNINVWVIPTMNPDGHALGRRQNARGVDLNRNFPKDWQRRTGVYNSGWKPASEPETRLVMGFISKYKPYTSVIAHQPFDLVDISSGGDRRVSQRLADLSLTKLVKLDTSNAPGAKTYTGTLTAWANSAVLMSTAVTYEFSASAPAWKRERLAWAVIVLAKERVNHLYRTRLDMKVTKSTVSKGTRIGLAAWMSVEKRDGWFYRSPGRGIQLWAKEGDGAWKRVAIATTKADGTVWIAQTPPASTCYQAKYFTTGTWSSKASPIRCVRVV